MPLFDKLLSDVQSVAPRALSDDGVIHTPADGLILVRYSEITAYTSTMYSPVLCMILQGKKEARTTDRLIQLSPGDTVVVSHQVPVTTRITQASSNRPYLAVIASIDLSVIRSLQNEISGQTFVESENDPLHSSTIDVDIVRTLERFVELINRPTELAVMAPLIRRELHYRLLCSKHGGMLRSMLDINSNASRIANAIELIRSQYATHLSVRAMAKAAAMSESAFHDHFKRITSTTPLQYLKDYRLLEAKRLLQEGNDAVYSVASSVGYESASQFSREYSRKFGNPPSADTKTS